MYLTVMSKIVKLTKNVIQKQCAEVFLEARFDLTVFNRLK